MEIREFAERILFGDTLADKLIDPESFSDRLPGQSITVPNRPARPKALAFPGAERRKKVPFPGIHELDKPRVRGHVLHFFANHELLAMELMALMLLRFPEAPESFRRGIVETIVEEQKHMRLYAERMEVAGVEFGEIPVNEYFWTHLKNITSPLQFVTGMSMTLEQANLDFSGYYRKAFRAIGDEDTADVLDIVFTEEIGHVKHGVVWFDRWRPPGSDPFETWMENLPDTLPAVRAKGLGFDMDARRRAGLDDQFISKLRVLGGSKGRPPNIYSFVPWIEEDAASRGTYVPSRFMHSLRRDLETLPLFLAASDDVVLVGETPDAGYLQQLAQHGYPIPEFVAGETLEAAAEAVEYDRIGTFVPWGRTPAMTRASRAIRGSRVVADPQGAPDTLRELHAKSRWTSLRAGWIRSRRDERLAPPDHRLGVPSNDGAVGSLLDAVGGGPILYRADFGAAGRGTRRFLEQQTSDDVLDFVGDSRTTSGVIEPLRDRVLDFSWQFDVRHGGGVQHHGIVRTLVDRRGQFRGAILNRFGAGLPSDVMRFVYDGGRDSRWLRTRMRDLAEHVASELVASGYFGPACIDGFVYRDGDDLRVEPLAEVNPRMTMGRVAGGFASRIASGSTPAWVMMSVSRAASLHGSREAAIRHITSLAEMEWRQRARDGATLSRGVVPTTDLARAELMLTFGLVGTNDDDLLELLAAADPELGEIARGNGLGWSPGEDA